MSTDNKQVTFKGRIIRCVYDSPDFKTYAVDFDEKKYPYIKKNRYGNASIIGELPTLTIGVEYDIVAMEQTSKYGISYKVNNIKRDIPTTEEDMYVFLQEILTPNQASVLYENYPDIVQRVKEDRLEDIDLNKLKGIKEYTFEIIKNKIIENFCLADLVVEFQGYLSLPIIKKIYNKYTSIDVLKEKLKKDPYKCLCGISGVGFNTADSILLDMEKASKENISKGKKPIIEFDADLKTSPQRCLSCAIYLLQENENEGHTKMNLADLRKECIRLVPACADHFPEIIKSEGIYYNKDMMDVALAKTYDIERKIAETIIGNLNNESNIWDYDIEKYRSIGEFELSDEQMHTLANVCKHSISILNGFAGSGKSASTQALINMLESNGKSYKIFAPTGKASKVISEFTHRSASTIHRGLGYMPPNIWTFNEDNKLNTDVVIVDEFSMVDIHLFKRLIDAIDFETTKLLMIGDNAQLCSVGCGNLLHDFMETRLIPTTTLTRIFRYQDGGLMKAATDIRCGKAYLDNSMKSKATVFGNNQDYTFVDLASEAIPKNAVALYKKLLDAGNSIENIQVLTAKNIHECGAASLNNMLQKVANPNYGSSTFMKVGDTVYYEGDLILQKVNNYKAELVEKDDFDMDFDKVPTAFVANGETGIIKEIYNTLVIIDFDGTLVKYYRNDMNMVGLGYAITIHKSQGSSIDNVIVCSPQSHIFMMNSNLLYVALTRTRKKCYHLGSLGSVNQAIDKKANLTRHTFMQQLLLDNK